MDLLLHKEEILAKANEQDPMLVSLGGGAKDLNVKVIHSVKGPMVIAELIVSTGDAMGANAVNTMAEAVAPILETCYGREGLPENHLEPGRQEAHQSQGGLRQRGDRRRGGGRRDRLRLRLRRGRPVPVLDAQQGHHERGHSRRDSLRSGHQGARGGGAHLRRADRRVQAADDVGEGRERRPGRRARDADGRRARRRGGEDAPRSEGRDQDNRRQDGDRAGGGHGRGRAGAELRCARGPSPPRGSRRGT